MPDRGRVAATDTHGPWTQRNQRRAPTGHRTYTETELLGAVEDFDTGGSNGESESGSGGH